MKIQTLGAALALALLCYAVDPTVVPSASKAVPIRPLSVQSNGTSNKGTIAVPPFQTRGFPNYADGTPCVGTPKDPTRWPDKDSNPCDGKPLSPEQLPGPFPAPIGYPPYADGTPCIGQPKDTTRFPNTFDNPCSGNPDGKPPKKDNK